MSETGAVNVWKNASFAYCECLYYDHCDRVILTSNEMVIVDDSPASETASFERAIGTAVNDEGEIERLRGLETVFFGADCVHTCPHRSHHDGDTTGDGGADLAPHDGGDGVSVSWVLFLGALSHPGQRLSVTSSA